MLLRFIPLAILLIAFISGCSISYSSGKSSDSIKSILSSSGGDGEQQSTDTATLYDDDVMAATMSFAKKKGTSNDFQNQISAIAKKHGITDWESEQITFTAMGKGLQQAGIAQEDISKLPYFNTLASSTYYSSILQAYKK